MALTTVMFLKPPCEALFGSSTGKARAPSRRAAASSAPEAIGKNATNAVDQYEGSDHAMRTVASSVKPNVVPMCRSEKFAFTHA